MFASHPKGMTMTKETVHHPSTVVNTPTAQAPPHRPRTPSEQHRTGSSSGAPRPPGADRSSWRGAMRHVPCPPPIEPASPLGLALALVLGLGFVLVLLLVRGLLVLRAAGDRDLGALLELGAVLRDEFGGYREVLGRAQVPRGRQRGVGALGERQFEARDGLVGDRLERARRDPALLMNVSPTKSIVTP